jgi:hypothetical protein
MGGESAPFTRVGVDLRREWGVGEGADSKRARRAGYKTASEKACWQRHAVLHELMSTARSAVSKMMCRSC